MSGVWLSMYIYVYLSMSSELGTGRVMCNMTVKCCLQGSYYKYCKYFNLFDILTLDMETNKHLCNPACKI